MRDCPKCGNTISHLRRNYCIHSSMNQQPCKRCSNKNNHPSGMVGAVRVAWFTAFYKSAISRGYIWNLTVEEVADLYEKQEGRCALTGWEIGWSETGWEHNASIDRLDNSLGYSIENIQLVHKTANMARGTLEIDAFVELCKAVANKIKW